MPTRSIDPIIHYLACIYHPLGTPRCLSPTTTTTFKLEFTTSETNNILTVVRRSLTKERKATVTLISFARSSQGKGVDLHTRKQRFELALSHFFTTTTKNLMAVKDGTHNHYTEDP
ncbi:uncharacterized protein CLUP02_03285 [Colletotrichum lupini]|uniref:Uncharacterized protein n=1 Tax=Colletotrichum lupini TaxID=145971 RepID=A0A9Q8WC13_9PEZI|nr:uncharacterized protein CLUP02_03285 [Colletotrichum lupini]UQC77814.1 hypothetical protein CLUP02_03285 [Colletotrichum lupini]